MSILTLGGFSAITVGAYTPQARRRFGWCKDVNNQPVAKRVILYRNGSYLGSTISRASDGYWEVKGLNPALSASSITEIAVDDTKTYESVVRDHKSLVA